MNFTIKAVLNIPGVAEMQFDELITTISSLLVFYRF